VFDDNVPERGQERRGEERRGEERSCPAAALRESADYDVILLKPGQIWRVIDIYCRAN